MNWRRIGGFTGLAFAGWFVLTSPENAAGIVSGIAGGLAGAAQSLSVFVSALGAA